jgi:hypothetical protein
LKYLDKREINQFLSIRKIGYYSETKSKFQGFVPKDTLFDSLKKNIFKNEI